MGLPGHLGREPNAWIGGSGREDLLIKNLIILDRAQHIETSFANSNGVRRCVVERSID
ncbi:hypothetical protein N8517_01400 [Synechococcus sp. AH-601-L23]|nr:hypothetical protein [Synechococcus sp. AH-601-L23]MDA7622233.1 hypothetical protein [bacterium]